MGLTQQTIQKIGRKYMFNKLHEWLKDTFGTKQQPDVYKDVPKTPVEGIGHIIHVEVPVETSKRKSRKKQDDAA